ncbi:MAG: O-antigen ligase family protein [Acidimicrobiales bacterium]
MLSTATRPEEDTRQPLREVPVSRLEFWLFGVTLFIFAVGLPTRWGYDAGGPNPLLTAAQLLFPALCLLPTIGAFRSWQRVIILALPALVYSGLALASTLWSGAPVETATAGLVLVVATAFAANLALRLPPSRLLRLLFLVGIATLIVNLAFVVALPSLGTAPNTGSFNGVFNNKNPLGRHAVVHILLALFAWRSRVASFPVAAITILGYAFLLIGSQSMTSIVALAGTLASVAIFATFRARRTLPGVVIGTTLALGTLSLGYATANLGLITEYLGKDITLTGRTDIWTNVIPIGLERPLLGWGFDAVFVGYFGPLHEAYIAAGWDASHAHNALIQSFMELGFVGLAVYLWIYWVGFVRGIAVARGSTGAIGLLPLGFVTYTVLTSITEIGPQSSNYVWIVLVYLVTTSGVTADRAAPRARLEGPRDSSLLAV